MRERGNVEYLWDWKKPRMPGVWHRVERELGRRGRQGPNAGEPVHHIQGLHSVLKAMGKVWVEEIAGRGKLWRPERTLQLEE